MTRTPSSWSVDVTPMARPPSDNQAFAWYSTRVSISVDLTGRVALVTGGSQGIGAGIAAVLVEAGATVVTCARSAVDDPGARHHARAVRRARPRRGHGDGRRASSPSTVGWTSWSTTPAGRRTPLAADASPRFLDKILGLNLTAPLHGRPGRQRGDAASGQRRHREHLLGLGAAPLARHRGVRRCQGRRGQPHPVAGRRVGTRRSASTPSTSGCAAPSRRPTTTAATRRCAPSRRRSRSAGWPNPPRSARSWRSSPRTSPAMSPAPPWSATAAASRRSSCTSYRRSTQ